MDNLYLKIYEDMSFRDHFLREWESCTPPINLETKFELSHLYEDLFSVRWSSGMTYTENFFGTSDLKNGPANQLRVRSHALLSKEELAMFRTSGWEVGFDPVQHGWVPLNSIDDIDPSAPQDVLGTNHCFDRIYRRQGTRSAGQQPQITFRQWQAQDLAQYKALLDDPDVWELLPEPYPNPLSDDLAASLIELSNEAGHHHVRAVLLDGVPVGQVRIVFAPSDEAFEDAEISYWLGRDHWGCGIGARMVAAFVEEVSARFPSITVLSARIHRDNTASARIARKAGFQKIGVADKDPNIDVYRIRLGCRSAESAG